MLAGCPDGATRIAAVELTATKFINPIQFVDDVDLFAGSEGGAAAQLKGMGEAGLSTGQIFRVGDGKTEAVAFGFEPCGQLRVQDRDVEWAQKVTSLGVTFDAGLNMDCHLAAMWDKARAALATISISAELAGVGWDDFVRVVPKRVVTKACFGVELVVVNQGAPARLNAMQRYWGAAILGAFPGDPGSNRMAGWKLMVELGWTCRLWQWAVTKAIMLDERAHLSTWAPLKAVLRHSRKVPGSWQEAVAALRERYGVPPFARDQARLAPSRAAVWERLKRYRKREVEPRLWAEAQEEVARERAKPTNALYNLLHPGSGPVPMSSRDTNGARPLCRTTAGGRG